MKSLLASSLFVCAANAFTLSTPAVHRSSSSTTRLLAAGGPPQYDKVQGTLREAETVGLGSVMLHIDTQDVIEYEPGHVLALEMQPEEDDSAQDMDAKTAKDAKENGGWMRGPYTVSRSTPNSMNILIKVVGDKSKRFSTANNGTPVQFGGKFHVPILKGVDVDTTKRVVFISTGVGVGPCVGAIEKALEQEESFPPIDLITSYRTEEEVIYKEHLNKLVMENTDKLSWKTIITSEGGRLSANVENLNAVTQTSTDAGIDSTHYHLIGNAQLVAEFKNGLQKAGVPDEKVTVESYFNHKAEADANVVDTIADAVKNTAAAAMANGYV